MESESTGDTPLHRWTYAVKLQGSEILKWIVSEITKSIHFGEGGGDGEREEEERERISRETVGS